MISQSFTFSMANFSNIFCRDIAVWIDTLCVLILKESAGSLTFDNIESCTGCNRGGDGKPTDRLYNVPASLGVPQPGFHHWYFLHFFYNIWLSDMQFEIAIIAPIRLTFVTNIKFTQSILMMYTTERVVLHHYNQSCHEKTFGMI